MRVSPLETTEQRERERFSHPEKIEERERERFSSPETIEERERVSPLETIGDTRCPEREGPTSYLV